MELLKVLANLIACLLSVNVLRTKNESIDHHIKLYEQTRILFVIISWNWLLIAQKEKKKTGLLELAAQLLIAVPLLVGIAVSDGVTECDRCAGDAERARCEGARAIDRNLLRTLEISVCQSSCEQRSKAKDFQAFVCTLRTYLNEGCFSLAFGWAADATHFRSVRS